MPWADVPSFQGSELYRKMKSLHAWSQAQLQRFIDVFAMVYSKAKREGASEEEAESTAIAIAMGAGRRVAQGSIAAALEPTRHYFVPMHHAQLGMDMDTGKIEGQQYSFRMLARFWDEVKAAVSGVQFNSGHDLSKPIGVIHGLHTAKEAAAMGLPVPDDAPFVMSASYFAGLGPSVRDEVRISAEWVSWKASDGTSEAIPISFAVTETPLNGEILGVRRIASLTPEEQAAAEEKAKLVAERTDVVTAPDPPAPQPPQPPAPPSPQPPPPVPPLPPPPSAPNPSAHLPPKGYDGSGASSMSDPPAQPPTDPEVRIASLNSALEAEKELRKKAEFNAAAWKSEFEKSKLVLEEFKAAASKRDAQHAAMDLLHAGKITADRVEHFADLYLKIGKEEFENLGASLQVSSLGAAGLKAQAAKMLVSDADIKAQKDRMAKLLAE